MGCNCGGRATSANTGIHSVWRHTDPHGGQVSYASKQGAEIALRARGGKIEQVDPRTGEIITTP
jgi:hypothetical protein